MKLLAAGDSDLGRYCTFQAGSAWAVIIPMKRVGRPKLRWTEETIERMWLQIGERADRPEEPPSATSGWQQGWVHLMAMVGEVQYTNGSSPTGQPRQANVGI